MEAKTKQMRGLLTKRPFYRISPKSQSTTGRLLLNVTEESAATDNIVRNEVTQADFIRELDTEAHAINDREIYKTYWQKDEDGKYYEADFPRYAFPFQQEILTDRHARLTGSDVQFDLADIDKGKNGWETYDRFKAGWADKGMERAWHYMAKSVLSTGDGAFVGILNGATFKWKVLSYATGDVLYPHYNQRTGDLEVFARTYAYYNNEGNLVNAVDVWDSKYYYHLIGGTEEDVNGQPDADSIGGYSIGGYKIDIKEKHGFNRVPIAYKRSDSGPCWSAVQEIIEHYEAAFSRLAQSNHEFGLPILGLYGDGQEIEEIATSDMSYASKVFLIPSEGKAEFLNRQDASPAYKTELDELKKKIYEGAMVVKAPELKSGDTPAAAIKLLYSDSYNMALLESQEYDEVMHDMIDIFKWGYGIESNHRLDFMNTRIVYYIRPFIPINDQEVTNNLAMAVQNGFCSKQTASEKFYHSTPNEWDRLLKEKHDEQMHELLIEEQRLDMQNEASIDMQEELSEIQTEQQIEVIEAQKESEEGEEDKAKNVKSRKGSVNTGRGRGRPRTVGTDKWGNRANENNWERWDASR